METNKSPPQPNKWKMWLLIRIILKNGKSSSVKNKLLDNIKNGKSLRLNETNEFIFSIRAHCKLRTHFLGQIPQRIKLLQNHSKIIIIKKKKKTLKQNTNGPNWTSGLTSVSNFYFYFLWRKQKQQTNNNTQNFVLFSYFFSSAIKQSSFG